jgi:hypothetical protein
MHRVHGSIPSTEERRKERGRKRKRKEGRKKEEDGMHQ